MDEPDVAVDGVAADAGPLVRVGRGGAARRWAGGALEKL